MECYTADETTSKWRLLGRAVLFMVGCAFILIVAAPLMPKLTGWSSDFILGSIATLWALLLTLVFVRWEGLRPIAVGVAPDHLSLIRFAVGFCIGLLLVLLTASVVFAAGYVHWASNSEFRYSEIVGPLLTYLVLSCREELAFHGYPLRNLARYFGDWPAQLFVALIFALEHRAGGYPWAQAIMGAGVGSLLFGMAALSTRGLAVPMGIHAAWNFGQWAIGEKGMAAIWSEVVHDGDDQNIQIVRTASYVTVMGIATFSFWLWGRRISIPHDRV